jgi:hypothetical protein
VLADAAVAQAWYDKAAQYRTADPRLDARATARP